MVYFVKSWILEKPIEFVADRLELRNLSVLVEALDDIQCHNQDVLLTCLQHVHLFFDCFYALISQSLLLYVKLSLVWVCEHCKSNDTVIHLELNLIVLLFVITDLRDWL